MSITSLSGDDTEFDSPEEGLNDREPLLRHNNRGKPDRVTELQVISVNGSPRHRTSERPTVTIERDYHLVNVAAGNYKV